MRVRDRCVVLNIFCDCVAVSRALPFAKIGAATGSSWPGHTVRHRTRFKAPHLVYPSRSTSGAGLSFRNLCRLCGQCLRSAVSLEVPDPLRQRQFVLGLLGHCLRLAPTDRSSLKELTALIARQIPAWQLARWPLEAAKWVSPRPVPPVNPRWPSRPTKPRLSRPPPLFGV